MAGVKGRSGGARPNTGGARPGAGRPRKEPTFLEVKAKDDALAFLIDVMNDDLAPLDQRVRAAIKAVDIQLGKGAAGGKKEEAADRAKQAAGGKFGSAPLPLKLVKRG